MVIVSEWKQEGNASLKCGSDFPIEQECLWKSYQADDLKWQLAKATFLRHSTAF